MQVLHQLPKLNNPSLLSGIQSRDDAAVYKLSQDTAIVQSVDFFPPNVDDPFTYGEIAAANAVSKIYAIGGKPLCALYIVSYLDNLPNNILEDIICCFIVEVSWIGECSNRYPCYTYAHWIILVRQLSFITKLLLCPKPCINDGREPLTFL